MEAQDVLMLDRAAFDSELDGLIESALNSASVSFPPSNGSTPELLPTTATSPAGQSDFVRPRTPSTSLPPERTSEPLSKRLKTEPGASNSAPQTHPGITHKCTFAASKPWDSHVHPSRRVLLDRPEANRQADGSIKPASRHPTAHATGTNSTAVQSVLKGPKASSQTTPTGPRSSCTPTKPESTPHGQSKTGDTLANAVRCQWDPKKQDLDYESRLEQRRKEKLASVDRYVPGSTTGYNGHQKHPAKLSFERLPDKIKERIVEILLISSEHITIDFYWLRSFVKGHARVPATSRKYELAGAPIVLPIPWSELLENIRAMQSDMLPFNKALEVRDVRTRKTRSPARGLSTALLRVSRKVHEPAARIFYGQNTFRFPCPTSAWIQLESFLATIGPRNITRLKKLRIHVPVWHSDVREDYVEGTIADMLSPATRMATIKPPAHDRLLSAVQYATEALLKADTVESLSLELVNGLTAEQWSGAYINDKRLISVSEAEEYVERKRKGVSEIKKLSEVLATMKNRPMLSVHHPSRSRAPDKKDFRKRMGGLIAEAENYGWQVDPVLRDTT